MPVVPAALIALIKTDIAANMVAISGTDPLEQQDPSYFIEMCTAIGTGIATGTPLVNFVTTDTGQSGVPPVPGVGTGIGITVDDIDMEEQIYTSARDFVIEDFGETTHDAFPPGSNNSGKFLDALSTGVASAVKSHFSTAWVLTSAHPLVYAGSGLIGPGDFSGMSISAVKSAIVPEAPRFVGPYWPRLAEAIATGYVQSIEQKGTGTVTIVGVCVPSITQLCGIPLGGSGTGVAA